MSELIEQLEQLQEALKAKNYVEPVAVMKVKDHNEFAEKYLSDLGAAALNGKKSKSLIGTDDSGIPVSHAIFFAVRVPTKDLEIGIQHISKVVNDLAEKGLIESVLSPINSIELARMPGEVFTSAVFFFPMVPIDKMKEAKSISKLSIEEGQVGDMLPGYSNDLKLPEGQFWAEARISSFYAHTTKYDHRAMLFKLVNEYLKFLPEGTELLRVNDCAITDLSIPYELIFSNPDLQKVKKVELEWQREAAVSENKIKQFNMFTGIKYFGEDGKQLYR
jgi:hypothetical protein